MLVLRAARSRVEEMQLHVVGRRPPGPFVGGAAGSHASPGPGSGARGRLSLRQARAWKTLLPHALLKELICNKRLHG